MCVYFCNTSNGYRYGDTSRNRPPQVFSQKFIRFTGTVRACPTYSHFLLFPMRGAAPQAASFLTQDYRYKLYYSYSLHSQNVKFTTSARSSTLPVSQISDLFFGERFVANLVDQFIMRESRGFHFEGRLRSFAPCPSSRRAWQAAC